LNAFSWFRECNYPVYLKYDALNSPCIQGNKYWKLYGLQRFLLSKGFKGVCTFGGTYSNHLAAMACWASDTGIPVLAYVRGEQPEEEHLTLQQMRKAGVSVRFYPGNSIGSMRVWIVFFPKGICRKGFTPYRKGAAAGSFMKEWKFLLKR
jgi:1-aminocyclopropane-1-carboxylate deaminase/D-cysteine desulfhydrase-like pyridoxal-dependent ACC family enzyme